jgi:hypothetical protein
MIKKKTIYVTKSVFIQYIDFVIIITLFNNNIIKLPKGIVISKIGILSMLYLHH